MIYIKKSFLLVAFLLFPICLLFNPVSARAALDSEPILDENSQDITFKLVAPSDAKQEENGSSNGNIISQLFPQLSETSGLIVSLLVLGVIAVLLSVYHIKKQRGGKKL